jgi:hypothetical protein
MAIAAVRVRETRRGEDWRRECERAASHSVSEAGNRRVDKRWRWVTWAEMEWSERVFLVVVS